MKRVQGRELKSGSPRRSLILNESGEFSRREFLPASTAEGRFRGAASENGRRQDLVSGSASTSRRPAPLQAECSAPNLGLRRVYAPKRCCGTWRARRSALGTLPSAASSVGPCPCEADWRAITGMLGSNRRSAHCRFAARLNGCRKSWRVLGLCRVVDGF
jgi:hypothetical protein